MRIKSETKIKTKKEILVNVDDITKYLNNEFHLKNPEKYLTKNRRICKLSEAVITNGGCVSNYYGKCFLISLADGIGSDRKTFIELANEWFGLKNCEDVGVINKRKEIKSFCDELNIGFMLHTAIKTNNDVIIYSNNCLYAVNTENVDCVVHIAYYGGHYECIKWDNFLVKSIDY